VNTLPVRHALLRLLRRTAARVPGARPLAAFLRARRAAAPPPPPMPLDALLAALPPQDRAPALMFQPTFFDLTGNNMFFGGAERYMLDLGDLLAEAGYDPVLVQMAGQAPWVRQYGRLRVVGLPCGGDFDLFRSRLAALLPRAALAVFSPFSLNPGDPRRDPRRGIGISHGIYWDHGRAGPSRRPDRAMRFLAGLRDLVGPAAACRALVSVDTATINWFRGTAAEIGRRFVYIPNYVDRGQFAPAAREAADGTVVVLYPRRLYDARGYGLVLEVAPRLLERHPHLVLEFCGKGDAGDLARLRPLQERFGARRVLRYDLPPERMHEAYRRADIAMIPTVASEGTSLSCLEAMACGKAIVATHVGGLPDLVIDGYNGLLIEPSADRLEAALEAMIADPGLRATCGRRAREVSEAFSIERWRARWRRVLAEEAATSAARRPAATDAATRRRGWAILHPATDGIDFEVMRQRPQQLLLAFARAGVLALFQNGGRPAGGGAHHPLLQVLEAGEDLYPRGQVVYLYYPFHARDLERFAGAVLVYDVLDDPLIHPDPEAARHHAALLARADLVVTSSRLLQEQLRPTRPDALLVPNGVWPEDFAAAAGRIPPRDGAPLRVGYAGAIAEWFDFGLLRETAAAMPDCEFHLAGPCTRPGELRALLEACPNVRHLGVLDYGALPGFYAGLHVGIVPFVLNEVTHKVSPLKMFEFLAAGRPVVATAMAEIAALPEVLVGDRASFAGQIRAAQARAGDPAFVGRALDLARSASWELRAGVVLETLDRLMASQGGAGGARPAAAARDAAAGPAAPGVIGAAGP
jgi:glycosyltransferase involved in cell wall biosynthesis